MDGCWLGADEVTVFNCVVAPGPGSIQGLGSHLGSRKTPVLNSWITKQTDVNVGKALPGRRHWGWWGKREEGG